MRKTIIATAIIFGAFAASPATAQRDTTGKTKKESRVKHYTCPMHPEVIQNQPGSCPKCGMKLEAKKPSKKK